MLILKNKNIDDILEEISDNKDMFILYRNRFELRKGERYINKNANCDNIAMSDDLEELMDYVYDNKLDGYLDTKEGNKYYYFYEIYKYYGENMRYIERINSFYGILYYDDITDSYYKIDELSNIITQRIKNYGVCFNLSFRRRMEIIGGIIAIYDEKREGIEAIKKKDITKRQDIIEEIISVNFKKV